MVLFGKSAQKMHTSSWSLCKILVPPLGMAVKNGYPPLRVPEAYQGSRGESRERGTQGGGELRERDILLCSVSFFVCVKNGYPPLGPLN